MVKERQCKYSRPLLHYRGKPLGKSSLLNSWDVEAAVVPETNVSKHIRQCLGVTDLPSLSSHAICAKICVALGECAWQPAYLLLHHAFQLFAILRVAEHPLKGLGIAHGLRQVLVEQLLHVGVPEELIHQV